MGIDLYLEQRYARDMIEEKHIDPLTKKPFYGTFEDWAYHKNGGHNLDKYLGYYGGDDSHRTVSPPPKSKYEKFCDGIDTHSDKTPDYYLNFIGRKP